jgi:hypothetical protein
MAPPQAATHLFQVIPCVLLKRLLHLLSHCQCALLLLLDPGGCSRVRALLLQHVPHALDAWHSKLCCSWHLLTTHELVGDLELLLSLAAIVGHLPGLVVLGPRVDTAAYSSQTEAG